MEFKPVSPWSYFVFTLVFSWTFWGILLLQSNRDNFTPYGPLFYIGGIAPMLSAATLTYMEKGRTGVINLIRASLNFTGLTFAGLLIILLVSTLPNILAVLIQKPQGSPLIAMDLSISTTAPWFTFLFIVSIIEETGWRGYALPRLLKHYDPLASSLILGTIWAVWHIPLFLIPGTWQSGLGFMTPAFISYMLQLLPQSYLMTWVYQRTGNNTASAILNHQLVNVTGELLEVTERADLLRFGIEIILAIILLFTS